MPKGLTAALLFKGHTPGSSRRSERQSQVDSIQKWILAWKPVSFGECTAFADYGFFSDKLREAPMACRYETCSSAEKTAKRRGESVSSKSFFFLAVTGGLLVLLPQVMELAEGANKATSGYALHVGPSLRGQLKIAGPASNTAINHDGTGHDQQLGLQQWEIQDNSQSGATVTFETNTAFRNSASTGTVKRDARLQLSIARQTAGGDWAITQATDQTNYTAGDEFARVSAASTQPGGSTFHISVTFVTADVSTLRAGIYSTTVIGTISSN